MDVRCGGPDPRRRDRLCRAFVGSVTRDGDEWVVEIRDDRPPSRRFDPSLDPLFDPGRWTVSHDDTLHGWCARHRRQIQLRGDVLIEAAERGDHELLIEPLRRSVRYSDVEHEPFWPDVEPYDDE
jgi:hypothetical protein